MINVSTGFSSSPLLLCRRGRSRPHPIGSIVLVRCLGRSRLVSAYSRSARMQIDRSTEKFRPSSPLSISALSKRLRAHPPFWRRREMEYLCLVYIDEKQIGTLSKEDMQVLDRGSLEYDEELQRSGHYIMARAL